MLFMLKNGFRGQSQKSIFLGKDIDSCGASVPSEGRRKGRKEDPQGMRKSERWGGILIGRGAWITLVGPKSKRRHRAG